MADWVLQPIEQNCRECGKPFVSAAVNARYCSKDCHDLASKKRKRQQHGTKPERIVEILPDRYCIGCKKLLVRRVSPSGTVEQIARFKTRLYCSPACYHANKRKAHPWYATFNENNPPSSGLEKDL